MNFKHPNPSCVAAKQPLNRFTRMSRKKCNAAVERVKQEMLDRAKKLHTPDGDGIAKLWIQAMACELRKEFGIK